jgi:diguanylate cyclase (GGDEF)-like protein
MLSGLPRRDSDHDSGAAAIVDARRRNDALTGLPNRARFLERVNDLIFERTSDPVPFAIALFDFNNFRMLNDVYGGPAGDDILAQAGRRLRGASPGGMFCARMGGDVFAVMMPMCFHDEAALEAGRLFADLLGAPYDIDGRAVSAWVSSGVALWRDTTQNAADIMRNAEAALRSAKRGADATIVVHNVTLELEARRTIELEQALRSAIASATLDVVFQPIVGFEGGRIQGVECLARWNDASLGNVTPDVFIDIAERRALMAPLSKVIFAKALSAVPSWPSDMFLAFNLSPSQLLDQSTFDMLISELGKANVAPQRLEIEVTETAVIANPALALRMINRLRQAGIGISLDDFGTGQSSLSRLREIPFTKLKIDRSFVQPISADKGAQTIVRAVLGMCEGLNMASVAEGVETLEQGAALLEMACNSGQGWLFGRPKSARDTEILLRANGRIRASLASAA